jgi:hypothetical protein
MDAAELGRVLELAANAPLGSYADAAQHKPLFDKLVKLHNAVAAGGQLTVLNAKEAQMVSAMRRGLACIAPGNTGPAAHADGIVPAGVTIPEEALAAVSE